MSWPLKEEFRVAGFHLKRIAIRWVIPGKTSRNRIDLALAENSYYIRTFILTFSSSATACPTVTANPDCRSGYESVVQLRILVTAFAGTIRG